MRLREIEPGMVIHCNNDEEKKALLKEAERLGYRWYGNRKMPTCEKIALGNTIHFHDKSLYVNYKYITWSDKVEGVTEFSDLILPELTAEEIVERLAKNYEEGTYKEVFGKDYLFRILLEDMTLNEVVEKIAKWKANHEKKEPEIETVDICRIIEIMPDGKKRCVHEEDMDVPANKEMEEILKRYCMEHDGEFIAVHEVISRVKK